jgi:outer membrane protein OmpA-like peptidoglycan-associated protein
VVLNLKSKLFTMRNYSKIFIALILGIVPFAIQAQKSSVSNSPASFMPHWNVQINGGLTQYFGDLNKDNLFNKSVMGGFSGIIGYQINPVFGVRGQFLQGKFNSKNDDKQLKLNDDLWDGSMQLTANINEIFSTYNPKRFVNFYVFGGAGLTSFVATLTDLSSGFAVDSIGKRQNELFVPVGVGAAFRMAKKVSLNIEYADHITFKDNTLDMFPASRGHDQYSYLSFGLGLDFGGPHDADKDGIKDKKDLCPNAAGKIELGGCPDRDNDGIKDSDDPCPDVFGKPEFKGCPDTDNDGIPDKDDNCPDVEGKKEFNGCPDTDNDGVIDNVDKCPYVFGKAELGGCPDKDGDGVIDKDDACPEIVGLAKFAGCPDKDNDGVPDNKDQCPDVTGTITNNGCPDQDSLLVNQMVHFETDASFFIAAYSLVLNSIAETLLDNPGIRITVDGHTDARESVEYNLKLSEKRAESVIEFFTDRGIDPSRIIKGFYGKSRPIADNSTEEGMSLNRRVEIKSVK